MHSRCLTTTGLGRLDTSPPPNTLGYVLRALPLSHQTEKVRHTPAEREFPVLCSGLHSFQVMKRLLVAQSHFFHLPGRSSLNAGTALLLSNQWAFHTHKRRVPLTTPLTAGRSGRGAQECGEGSAGWESCCSLRSPPLTTGCMRGADKGCRIGNPALSTSEKPVGGSESRELVEQVLAAFREWVL